MTLSRLAELTADPTASFVLIARDGADTVELLTGEVVDVDLLADIPLTIEGTLREIFAMVPYRQVRERGFVAQDDGAPLRCIVVDEHLHLPASELVAELPSAPVPLRDGGFGIVVHNAVLWILVQEVFHDPKSKECLPGRLFTSERENLVVWNTAVDAS